MLTSDKQFIKNAHWTIWYQDMFDLACPRQHEVEGRGLIDGLIALWVRHLFETVRPEGQLGFSRFNLWWTERKFSVSIQGQLIGQINIRQWVFHNCPETRRDYFEFADNDLLVKISRIHAGLLLAGQACDILIDLAADCKSRSAYLSALSSINIE